MCNMPATTAGMNAIPDQQVAQGSAMNNVIRQIFSSFGIVFFSIYYEVRRAQLFATAMETDQATLQTLNEAFMIAGVFILLMIPVSFVMKGTEELKRSSASA